MISVPGIVEDLSKSMDTKKAIGRHSKLTSLQMISLPDFQKANDSRSFINKNGK